MSDNDKKDKSTNEIDELLKEYENSRSQHQFIVEELEPPEISDNKPNQTLIGNIAKEVSKEENTKENKNKKKPKKEKKEKVKKEPFPVTLKKFSKSKIGKISLLSFGAIVLIIVIIIVASCLTKSVQSSYLKPYEDKYNMNFPTGMLEEYCDMYAYNKSMTGYLKIMSENAPIINSTNSDSSHTNSPFSAKEISFITTIYASSSDLSSLENSYSTVSAFSSSDKYITYDTIYEKNEWRVVGAFYTNTNATDDNGYIFPYDIRYDMTSDSVKEYLDRLQTRFIYSSSTITRSDKILLISVDSSVYSGYKFVLACTKSSKSDDNITARENTNIHYPQGLCDTLGIKNSYALSSKWYPTVYDPNNEEKTIVHSIENYQ